jgi:hypothetical protein
VTACHFLRQTKQDSSIAFIHGLKRLGELSKLSPVFASDLPCSILPD